MIPIKNINKLSLFALIVLLCSCVKEPIGRPNITEEGGVLVKVSMRLKVPSFDSPKGATTRGISSPNSGNSFDVQLIDGTEVATRSSGTTSLYNLWVCQFSSDGAARKITKLSDIPEAVKDMVTIDAELITGTNQTIYLVALGRQYPDINLSSIKNISELNSYNIPFIRYEDGLAVPIIKEEEDVPYRGSQSGLNIIQIEKNGRGLIEYSPTSNFLGAIPIYAMVSKVTLNFSFGNTNFSPYMLTLNNVPTTYSINNPDYKPTGFATFPATLLDAKDFVGDGRKSISWYVAPNPQGVVSNLTSEYERYYYWDTWTAPKKPAFKGNAALKDVTYINFWAKDDSIEDNYAIYYMFLGGNTTNDVNILAHNHYNLRSDINTTNSTNDKRIVYRALTQTIDFSASEIPSSGTTSMLRSGMLYDFDAHADMRPIEVSALRGNVTIEILTTADEVTPTDKSVSWLKLSSYPNYTEAYNKAAKNDSEGLVTSITKNVTIPGIFKFYLYVDEYEKYIYGDSRTVDTRSLYVRFTFNNGTTKDVTTVKMTQRPGLYLGQFGGDFDKNTGEYSKGLAFESVSELNNGVKYLSYHQFGSPIPRGVYSVDYDILCDEYKVGELYSGKEPSYCSVLNEKGYSFLYASLVAETPKYVNGKLDLNQYSINKQNYYSARYCFDKNRDNNGDGYISGDEIVWYYPAYFQGRSVMFNLFNDLVLPNISNIWPATATGDGVQTISQPAKNEIYYTKIYNSDLNNSTYDDKYNKPVCVRDVELPADNKLPKGFKVYAENEYAVIDATGLHAGARSNRGDDPTLILRDDKRVIRHFYPKGIDNKTLSSYVSSRFAVATYDIDIDGNERTYTGSSTGMMNWADASGFMEVGNDFVFDLPLNPRDVGCPMYGGKNGTEKGQWRLPTESEAILIDMMNETMLLTFPTTGYKSLIRLQNSSSTIDVYYWTSSEIFANSGVNIKFAAVLHQNVKISGGKITRNVRAISRGINKTMKGYVRCIKDLPVKTTP